MDSELHGRANYIFFNPATPLLGNGVSYPDSVYHNKIEEKLRFFVSLSNFCFSFLVYF